MLRRSVLALPVALFFAACKKEEPRCKHCGMKIDPASPWKTELVSKGGQITTFDTPSCAFTSWRNGQSPASSLRVQDYYDHQWHLADELRFMVGGDVLGPMGPDLVPVMPALVTKFIQDHGADRAMKEEEITAEYLKTRK